jgi:hypothetical protein
MGANAIVMDNVSSIIRGTDGATPTSITLRGGNGGTGGIAGSASISGGDGADGLDGGDHGTDGGNLTLTGGDGGDGDTGLRQAGDGGDVNIDCGAVGATNGGVAGNPGIMNLGLTNASAVNIAGSSVLTTFGGAINTNTIEGTASVRSLWEDADADDITIGGGTGAVAGHDLALKSGVGTTGNAGSISITAATPLGSGLGGGITFTTGTGGTNAPPGNMFFQLGNAGPGVSNGGGFVTFNLGDATGVSAGGNFTVNCGDGGTTGAGGGVDLNGGQGGATNGTGGAITIDAGPGGGTTGNGGNLSLNAGTPGNTGGTGGNAFLNAGGGGTTSGNGGSFNISGGNCPGGSTGAGGQASILGGNAGASGTASGGDIVLNGGSGSGGGADGSIDLGVTTASAVNIMSGAHAGTVTIGNLTNTGLITVQSTGGIDLRANSTGTIDLLANSDITLVSTANQVQLSGGAAAANAIIISAVNAAGGIDINAGTGGIDIDVTGGGFFVNTTTGGGIELASQTGSSFDVTGAGEDLALTSSGGQVSIDAGEALTNAVHILASHASGGVDIEAGTGGVDIDTTGEVIIKAGGAQIRTHEVEISDGVQFTIVTISLAAGEMSSGHMRYAVYATDGTDLQTYTDIVAWSAVNKSGTIHFELSDNQWVDGTGVHEPAVSAGTLTVTTHKNVSGANIQIDFTATSSLTTTDFRCRYWIEEYGTQTITPAT